MSSPVGREQGRGPAASKGRSGRRTRSGFRRFRRRPRRSVDLPGRARPSSQPRVRANRSRRTERPPVQPPRGGPRGTGGGPWFPADSSSNSTGPSVSNSADTRSLPSSSPSSLGSFWHQARGPVPSAASSRRVGSCSGGLAEITSEAPGVRGQRHQAPVADRSRPPTPAFSMAASMLSPRRRSRRLRAKPMPSSRLGDAAQGARGGAFGEQVRSGPAAQLHRQRPSTWRAGEQGHAAARRHQQFGDRLRIPRANGFRLPGASSSRTATPRTPAVRRKETSQAGWRKDGGVSHGGILVGARPRIMRAVPGRGISVWGLRRGCTSECDECRRRGTPAPAAWLWEAAAVHRLHGLAGAAAAVRRPPFSNFVAIRQLDAFACRQFRFRVARLARPVADLAEPAAGAGGDRKTRTTARPVSTSPRSRARHWRMVNARGDNAANSAAPAQSQHHQPEVARRTCSRGPRGTGVAGYAKGLGARYGADGTAAGRNRADPGGVRQHRRVRRRHL